MSGHSKWATTKHKKAIIDAKRAKLFTKAAKLITIAARDGESADPTMNASLRLAIDNAKAISMPRDNIDRAISRGIGGSDEAATLEEITYEAYAPGGVALLIECLTDNKNRALSEIKMILNKAGGSLANSGSVAYLFKKIGQIIVDEDKNDARGEDLEMKIIDSGADDFEKDENIYIVTSSFSHLNAVKNNLQENGIIIDSAESVQIPSAYCEVPEDKKEQIEKLLDDLDDLDDVNNVYSNANL